MCNKEKEKKNQNNDSSSNPDTEWDDNFDTYYIDRKAEDSESIKIDKIEIEKKGK